MVSLYDYAQLGSYPRRKDAIRLDEVVKGDITQVRITHRLQYGVQR